MPYVSVVGVDKLDNATFKKLMDNSITEITAQDLAGVTSIASYRLEYCTNLKKVTVPPSVTSLGASVFANDSLLEECNLPDGITTIGNSCFSNCVKLKSIHIPKSLTSIGSATFGGLVLIPDVVIPSGVTSIEGNAFLVCRELKKIVVTPIIPPTLANVSAFSQINANATFYLPLNSISSYTGATNWSSVLTTYSYAPLVSTIADLSNIDTATYVKACVVGADESYKEYTYDGSQWNEVV